MGVNDLLLNTLDRTIVEDFGNSVMDSNFDIDPWSQNLVQNSMGVTKTGLAWQYGTPTGGPGTVKSAWTKVMVYRTGLAGGAQWRQVSGNAPLNTGDNDQFVVYGTSMPQGFPTGAEMTVPAYHQSFAQLKEMYGMFQVPLELLRADQSDHNITSQIGAIIEGAARRVALREILAFWGEPASSTTNGPDSGAYLVFTNNSGSTVTPGTSDTTFTAGSGNNANGLTRYMLSRLQNGELVDVWTDANPAARLNIVSSTVVPAIIHSIDTIALTFKLRTLQGSWDAGITNGTTVYVFPYKSSAIVSGAHVSNTPTPLANVIKSSGTVFGLSLSQQPQYKSLVKALSGGETTPTENVLNKYVGGLVVAKPASGRIDRLVTTPGVKVKYINNQVFTGRRERASVPVSLSEGFSKQFDYTYDGLQMQIDTSNFCPSGTMYGLKLRGGNWQKLTPPPIPGSGSDSRFGSYVEFIGNISGNSIFMPTREGTTAGPTDFVEAPFKRHVEYVCEYIPGLKLTGLDEEIATS